MPHEPVDIMLHRPPMLLIDKLVSYSESQANAQTTFAPQRYGAHENHVSEPALVECMAQTVAAHRGQIARDNGIPPQPGMLVGVQDTSFHGDAACDSPLDIQIEIKHKLGALYLVDCTITQASKKIVEGTLKFFAPDEAE